MQRLPHDELLARRLTVEEALAVERHPIIAVLENVRSLYNVGSCFRTADAMLLERLVLTGYTPHPPRPEIDKTALGATSTVPWAYERDTVAAIEGLRSEGYTIVAVEIAEGALPLDADVLPATPVALVFGNELGGVSEGVLALCDSAVAIPMYGVKHSLNIAVAFGIAAWEFVRRAGASVPASGRKPIVRPTDGGG